MSIKITGILIMGIALFFLSFKSLKKHTHIPSSYKGVPFMDSFYSSGAQLIPGRVECKYFDFGGEGVAYHDMDSVNRGSGQYNYKEGHCNGVTDYVCHFREKEGVDLSYTKEFLDFNHENPFTPERQQGYIGWTKNGEWCNYTVNVTKVGKYKVGILYSNQAASFKLAINGRDYGEYQLPMATGSYHIWNFERNVGTIVFFNKGLNLLTLKYMGGANYAYLIFEPYVKQ